MKLVVAKNKIISSQDFSLGPFRKKQFQLINMFRKNLHHAEQAIKQSHKSSQNTLSLYQCTNEGYKNYLRDEAYKHWAESHHS